MSVALRTVALVGVIFLLRAAAPLLIPLVLAVLISYALEPVVGWLVRQRLPRALAAAVVVTLVLGGIVAGLYTARDDAARVLENLPTVARNVQHTLWRSDDSPARHVREAASVISRAPGEAAAEPGRAAVVDDGASMESLVAEWMYFGVGSLMALIGHASVIIFLVFFLLAAGDHVGDRLVEIASDHERRKVISRIVADINAQLQRFLLVRLATAVVVAVATWAVLAWVNVPHPAAWGLLAGVLNSIPYLGPVIVSGGLLVVTWAETGDPGLAVFAAGAALGVTALEGWLLTPVWLGRTERMHVLVIFVGVLFWTWMWGPWGTVLAVPMLVVVKAVADRVDELKPFGRLLAP